MPLLKRNGIPRKKIFLLYGKINQPVSPGKRHFAVLVNGIGQFLLRFIGCLWLYIYLQRILFLVFFIIVSAPGVSYFIEGNGPIVAIVCHEQCILAGGQAFTFHCNILIGFKYGSFIGTGPPDLSLHGFYILSNGSSF